MNDTQASSILSRHVENPLPAPLDGAGGQFLLEAAIWAVLAIWLVGVVGPLLKWATRKTPTDIDQHIIGIILKPGFLLTFLFGLVDSSRVLDLGKGLRGFIEHTWSVLFIVLVVYMIYRVWHEVILGVGREVSKRTESQLDDRLYPLFDKVGGVIIIFVGIWMIVDSFGINMTLFAAGGAVGGLVIAFAAQDTLGNLFAGVFIMLDQPFREGDRIEINDLNTWGDVVEIGLRTTRIRTRDNRMVVVPNSVIGSNPVVNHSFPDTSYRIESLVGVAYGSDLEKAKECLVEAAGMATGVDQDNRIEALFVGFGDSSLDFRIRYWVNSYADTRRVQDSVNMQIERVLRENNIEIPFPQRVVHMHNA